MTTVFDSAEEAEAYIATELIPVISKRIRLFKTPKQRQDEYLVIDDEWLGDEVFQAYAQDRDITDRLAAYGVPAIVSYRAAMGKGLAALKYVKTFGAWRRSLDVQSQRLAGLCYLPGQPNVVGPFFNTFRDVSVEPEAGVDISEMLDHIHDNLCNRNTAYYSYVMNWLAHLVQFPHVRPKTGMAIIGGQGTGKGIFVEFVKRMLGGSRNVNSTASSDDTKNFNYALGNKLLLVFDEATFAGDRKQSDFMKKLVTEPRIRIEQKGLDAYEVDNFARIIITSNNMQSAVPATLGARRWLIMECQNDLSQDELGAFAHRMEDEKCVRGFKHHLLSLDLTAFDPTKLPKQDTGFATKLQNHYKEDPVYAFLCEWVSAPKLKLYRMRVGDSVDRSAEYDECMDWDQEVKFSTFYATFKEACSASFGRPPGQNTMRSLLEPFGIGVRAGTGNIRFLHMPEPTNVLDVLEKSSRFDLLVSSEQRKYLEKHVMHRDELARTESKNTWTKYVPTAQAH